MGKHEEALKRLMVEQHLAGPTLLNCSDKGIPEIGKSLVESRVQLLAIRTY